MSDFEIQCLKSGSLETESMTKIPVEAIFVGSAFKRRGGTPLVECKLVQPLWKTVWRFLRKLKIELPYDPAVSLQGMYTDKTVIQKDTCTPMFIAALFTIAKVWKQPKCP